MSNGGRTFTAMISVKTDKQDENGNPRYRRTYLGRMFENERPNQPPYFTFRCDLFPHAIYFFEDKNDGQVDGGTATEAAPPEKNTTDMS